MIQKISSLVLSTSCELLFISREGMPVYSDMKREWQKHFCFNSEFGNGLGYNGFATSGIDHS